MNRFARILPGVLAVGLSFFQVSCSRSPADAITEVLEASASVSKKASAFGTYGEQAKFVADSFQTIDVTDCPADFRMAYQEHILAWRAAIPAFEANTGTAAFGEGVVAGFTGDPQYLGQAQAQADSAGQRINGTYATLASIAAKYGARIPTSVVADPQSNPGLGSGFEKVFPPKPWYSKLFGNWFVRIILLACVIAIVKKVVSGMSSSGRVIALGCSQDAQGGMPAAPAGKTPPALPRAQEPQVVRVGELQPEARSVSAIGGQWFYQDNGREYGPFDEAAIKQLRSGGVIGANTRIKRQGAANWLALEDVFGTV